MVCLPNMYNISYVIETCIKDHWCSCKQVLESFYSIHVSSQTPGCAIQSAKTYTSQKRRKVHSKYGGVIPQDMCAQKRDKAWRMSKQCSGGKHCVAPSLLARTGAVQQSTEVQCKEPPEKSLRPEKTLDGKFCDINCRRPKFGILSPQIRVCNWRNTLLLYNCI